eukprot:TRINITY_DN12362_c0_g1_i2.p1 TRINITY_DN12362_c0_g1~~TRINITY_DN12362_c0_g1_i2.p1  ORF type:complete len:183 (+),score=22.56 TRINITY_DN12362_c0_g1_i2:180-728(+)
MKVTRLTRQVNRNKINFKSRTLVIKQKQRSAKKIQSLQEQQYQQCQLDSDKNGQSKPSDEEEIAKEKPNRKNYVEEIQLQTIEQQKEQQQQNSLFGKPWWEYGTKDNDDRALIKQKQQLNTTNNEFIQQQYLTQNLGQQFVRQKSLEEINEEVSAQFEEMTDSWKQRRKLCLKYKSFRESLV